MECIGIENYHSKDKTGIIVGMKLASLLVLPCRSGTKFRLASTGSSNQSRGLAIVAEKQSKLTLVSAK